LPEKDEQRTDQQSQQGCRRDESNHAPRVASGPEARVRGFPIAGERWRQALVLRLQLME
jgi:hypothetical protein